MVYHENSGYFQQRYLSVPFYGHFRVVIILLKNLAVEWSGRVTLIELKLLIKRIVAPQNCELSPVVLALREKVGVLGWLKQSNTLFKAF